MAHSGPPGRHPPPLPRPGPLPNKFYGETCIGKMDNWVFNLSPGANGQWAIDGRMTVPDATCTKNPAAELHIGEWACYGTGGRLKAGMGFRLQPNGAYVDLDNKRAGRYTDNRAAATLTVQGGFLDGQTGKSTGPNSFQISNTVSCEPWR